MIRLVPAAASAALLVLAGACSGIENRPPELQWTKPESTPEDVKRDLYWCSTTRYRYTERIDPSRRNANHEETKVTDDECMVNRGYRRAPKG